MRSGSVKTLLNGKLRLEMKNNKMDKAQFQEFTFNEGDKLNDDKELAPMIIQTPALTSNDLAPPTPKMEAS
jgi:hypothetical protein